MIRAEGTLPAKILARDASGGALQGVPSIHARDLNQIVGESRCAAKHTELS
jgi:hypothetical protein